jgi:L-threonylcarbamoyladenylate synthase
MTVTSADAGSIRHAAQILREGRLVVFPTETVYGLGANALDPDAVRRIFLAKDRPPDNPLIVHVPDVAAAQHLVTAWPPAAERLAAAFWPGPLTLVLPRSRRVPDIVTAGLDSVAVRNPQHYVALSLLREAGVPIAAPSANSSGRPSPTRIQDAVADLGDQVTLYLDAGPTEVGLESTVVSLLGPQPVILRPGGVPREAIEKIVGPVSVQTAAAGPVRSPGVAHVHYAPRARLVLCKTANLTATLQRLRQGGRRVAAVASHEAGLDGTDVRVPGSRGDARAWAHGLFATLRDLDEQHYETIVVEEIPEAGLGAAVMDRLRRGAGLPADGP